MANPPVATTQSNASEIPPAARKVLHRAASSSWDCNTVVLLFATKDFYDLAINWAQQAQSIGVTNFVLVAMDKPLANVLSKFEGPPGLLLPRVENGDVTITKLNVIGERQVGDRVPAPRASTRHTCHLHHAPRVCAPRAYARPCGCAHPRVPCSPRSACMCRAP